MWFCAHKGKAFMRISQEKSKKRTAPHANGMQFDEI
jgi:hypothetical protein